MSETPKDIELKNLFDTSNYLLFKNQSPQANDLCFSKSILSKYPSDFFDIWIKKIGITKRFTTSLIDNIVNADTPLLKQELIHLLYSLIEKKHYSKKNVVHLENLLLSHNMYHHIIYLRMYIKEKIQPITSDNLNFLIGLTKVGIVNEQINNQILKLSLDQYDSLVDVYDLIVSKMLSLNNEEQLDLVARVNPTVFQLLLDSNVINTNDKKLQKILSYSAKTQNIDLYMHLLQNHNTIPSKSDILEIFGLVPTGKSAIRTKVTRGRRYRYRYISPSVRFTHKFNFKKSICKQTYMTKLINLVKYYTEHNIELSPISGIKHFICYLVSLNYLELQLEICKNIGYKHGGLTLTSLIRQIILKDNDILLKKFIDYSQIDTEKFVNGSYLTSAVQSGNFKVSQFMIDVLKMKTTGSAVVRGCINCAKLKFLHKNNLPIQENIMNLLFSYGDIASIDYCIETFNFKVTNCALLHTIKSHQKKSLTILKKYYPTLEHKCPLKILSCLLNNTITIHTLPTIKLILKDTKIKSTIMQKVLNTHNLSIIKYFCNTQKLTLNNVSCKNLQELMEPTTSWRGRRWCRILRGHRRRSVLHSNNDPTKILKILQYIKDNYPTKFEEFNETLIDRDTFLSNFLTYVTSREIIHSLSNILDMTQTIFEWKMPEKTIYGLLKALYDPIDIKQLFNYYPNLSQKSIEDILSSIDIYDNYELFVEITKKFNIDVSKYTTSTILMKNLTKRYISVESVKYIIDSCQHNSLKLTPAIYTYFVKQLPLESNTYSRNRKYRMKFLIELNNYYNKITLEDYNSLLKYFKNISLEFDIVEYQLENDEKLENFDNIQNNIINLGDFNNNINDDYHIEYDNLDYDNIYDNINDNVDYIDHNDVLVN